MRNAPLKQSSCDAERHVSRVVRWTHVGFLIERLVLAFWPVVSIVCLFLAFAILGVYALLSTQVWMGLCTIVSIVTLIFLWLGVRKYQHPSTGEARQRVDDTLPNGPLQTLADNLPNAEWDDGTREVWHVHQRQMMKAALQARTVLPRLDMRQQDPYALRLVALTALAMALLFGPIITNTPIPNSQNTVAQGPIWEGWVEPPAYTGKPTLYLADTPEGFSVPKGSNVLVRLYGNEGDLSLRESVTENNADTEKVDEIKVASTFDFQIEHSGEIEISGSSGRLWNVALVNDTPPRATLVGDLTRAAAGELRQEYSLEDDFGITRAVLKFELDAANVVPQFGYVHAPDPRGIIEIALALPQVGTSTLLEGTLAENLSKHAFASLPVRVSLQAWDGAGQASEVALQLNILPGRQFFDPLAAALVDVRAELMWSKNNAQRAARILRAVSYAPNDIFERGKPLALRLRALAGLLEQAGPQVSDLVRDETSESLWEIAVELEDGDLAQALERLRRAQERLAQAMKDGASAEDIERLMDEMREASREYLRQLAEQQGENEVGENSSSEAQEVTPDQIQELMDRIQELMEQGRMTEAQRLMDMLNELLENMQVQQGQGNGSSSGQGGQSGSSEAQSLQETLRGQQELSDETFNRLQEQFGQSGAQEGTDDEGTGGGEALGQRQESLREDLEESLDGEGPLSDAEQAMRDAQRSLSEGEYADALDEQARALEAMREGLRQLAEQNEPAQSDAEGEAANEGAGGQDPLGRDGVQGNGLRSDGAFNDEDTAHNRAQDLSEDLRRRAAEQDREDQELEFFNRLLKQY